jgi:hypothetical protein
MGKTVTATKKKPQGKITCSNHALKTVKTDKQKGQCKKCRKCNKDKDKVKAKCEHVSWATAFGGTLDF